ncbi:MAG: DUF721 domain-containing protein, partial [Selenomonas sp.]|nr:DUF721 domain-containing protein [Selenomonas sp.]
LLSAFYQERQWQEAWQIQNLYSKWPGIVGAEAARHSLPVALRGQTLWIYVSHAVWAQELSYRQPELFRQYQNNLTGLDTAGLGDGNIQLHFQLTAVFP